MYDYVERVINEFPMKLSKSYKALTTSGNNIFEKAKIKRKGKKETEEFHTLLARGMFLAKRAGPDIHQLVAVLPTRVK